MKEKLKKFIIENFMEGGGILEDNEPLFDSGIIDSLGFIKLLAFIEGEFKVSIDMIEVSIDNFRTIDDIIKILEKKIK